VSSLLSGFVIQEFISFEVVIGGLVVAIQMSPTQES
jgi:hypothetical protein